MENQTINAGKVEQENTDQDKTQSEKPSSEVDTNTQNAESEDAEATEKNSADESDGKKVADEEQKQSKELDAKYAKLRHERDVAKAKEAGDKEGYKRARIKSVGGKNPYSDNSPIETDEDYEFYELQDEVKNRGLDPKNPLDCEKVRREIAKKAREDYEKSLSEEQKAQNKADKEVRDYLAKGHTTKELNYYLNNPQFQEFSNDLLGVLPLENVINKFNKIYGEMHKEIEEQISKEARNKSNPGSSSSIESNPIKKSIQQMSDEEFKTYIEEIKSGKRKIN